MCEGKRGIGCSPSCEKFPEPSSAVFSAAATEGSDHPQKVVQLQWMTHYVYNIGVGSTRPSLGQNCLAQVKRVMDAALSVRLCAGRGSEISRNLRWEDVGYRRPTGAKRMPIGGNRSPGKKLNPTEELARMMVLRHTPLAFLSLILA